LYRRDIDTAGTMRVTWEMLHDGIFPVELCLEQMPARFERNGRTFDTAFRPIQDAAGAVARVVVVVSDITAELSAARAEAAKQELADLLDQALTDRAGFKELLDEGRRLLEEIGEAGDAIRVRRAIHTLKGNAGLWQLKSVVGLCHAIENEHSVGGPAISAAQRQALLAAWQETTSKVARLLSRDTDEVSIRLSDYEALVDAIYARRPHEELDAVVSSWAKEPVARRFRRFGLAAKALAERLGKPELQVEIEADELRTSPAQFSALWGAFTHVIRNAVDHGIEAPDGRVAAGKPAGGRLTLRARALAETVVIEVADDGRGIDWKALATKARKAGLPAQTHADLIDAMFSDGISTRDQASEISGRGVGLAAVRAAATALGASIDVRSELGAGTCFTFRFPSAWFQRSRLSRSPRSTERASQPAPKA
jgi:two-component system chemotaxis sensor kinase CheA